jgi:hypothetical protein
VGHRAVPPLAHETAAVLACQPHAMLSERTAARLSLLPVPDDSLTHVTVVGRSRRSLEGVKVHSMKQVATMDVARRDGLPVTSLLLTLLDLAGSLAEEPFAVALNEARVQRRVSDRALFAVLDRYPNRKGSRALRSLLAAGFGPRITRSEAERRALLAMRDSGIVPDASDHSIGPYRVDFWFERERVAMEVDGYRYHGTPKRFVDDRRRTAYLAARGILTFPLTWADLDAPEAMARLHATLASRGG